MTSCRKPKCPSAGELINELCHIHTVKYNSAIEKNKALIEATTQLYLKNTVLNKKSDKKDYLPYDLINIIF